MFLAVTRIENIQNTLKYYIDFQQQTCELFT